MESNVIKILSVVILIVPASVMYAQSNSLQGSQSMKNGVVMVSQPGQKHERTWKVKHVLEHDSSVFVVAISPNGQEVAAGGIVSPTISIWDIETGKSIRNLRGLKGGG